MRVHILQHVSFEGPSCIQDWCHSRQLTLSRTRFFAADELPDIQQLDLLIVLGGPMGVADSDDYSWLTDEIRFIRDCIAANKVILGICLGAQLIAHCLGARVTKNPHKEIGWFDVQRHPSLARQHPLADILPERFCAFHWHGETFALPDGALPLASSAGCKNQGFLYNDRILALQFHLEPSLASARQLIEHCRDELVTGPFIQSGALMLAEPARFDQAQQHMVALLDYLLQQVPGE
jgi:GMP synthase (glutamine-hydrolysing)